MLLTYYVILGWGMFLAVYLNLIGLFFLYFLLLSLREKMGDLVRFVKFGYCINYYKNY